MGAMLAAIDEEAPMPEFRTVNAGELKVRVAIEGQGPLVLMVHGFPESWRSWRNDAYHSRHEALELVCPVNKIGQVDVYLTTHHGMDMSGPANSNAAISTGPS